LKMQNLNMKTISEFERWNRTAWLQSQIFWPEYAETSHSILNHRLTYVWLKFEFVTKTWVTTNIKFAENAQFWRRIKLAVAAKLRANSKILPKSRAVTTFKFRFYLPSFDTPSILLFS
jgi:hypothetical protein